MIRALLFIVLSLLGCTTPNRFINRAELSQGMDNHFPVIRDDDEMASIKPKVGGSVFSNTKFSGTSETISSYETVRDEWGVERSVLTGRSFGNKGNYRVNTPSFSLDAGIDFNTNSPLGLHGFMNYSQTEDLNAFLWGGAISFMFVGEMLGGGFYLKGVTNQIHYDFEVSSLEYDPEIQAMVVTSTVRAHERSETVTLGLGTTFWLRNISNTRLTTFLNWELNALGIEHAGTRYPELDLSHTKVSFGVKYPLTESFGIGGSVGANYLEGFGGVSLMSSLTFDYYIRRRDQSKSRPQ